MTRRQKIFLWILFAIHVFFIYSCFDGYYDAIIKGCVDWGPSNHCPWGSEAMGIVWENPYSYVYFVSRNFIESLSVVIFAIIAECDNCNIVISVAVADWFLHKYIRDSADE